MDLLKTLAPAALILALGAITSSVASAQGASLARAADKMVAGSAKLYHQAKAKPAGSCGTHMYWKKGKCVDARNKK
jgi:hypothetical protein